MTHEQNKNSLLLTPEQVAELTAIYEDYMYAVRIFESLFQTSSVLPLASFQMKKLGLKNKSGFPWHVQPLTAEEKQQFQDFSQEKIHYNTGNAYITTIHTNPEDDKFPSIRYIPKPYMLHKMDMSLPSAVERYLIIFPTDATIKDTEFFVDNLYKAKYLGNDDSPTKISDLLLDPDKRSEFRILINFLEGCHKHKDNIFKTFRGLVLNAYATELTASYENIMLEMLGSFAEKIQNITRSFHIEEVRQNVHDRDKRLQLCKDIRQNALKYAEQDHLIPSATDFQDYVHIRHLMRHQWDTMDELGFFDSASADENYNTRMKYMASYRRLCDKTIVKRMKSYIEVLHQMQYVMRQIAPYRLIREPSESNSKFAERVKEYHRQNPDSTVTVEINENKNSNKHKKLCSNLHKVVPQIIIRDDFSDNRDKFRNLELDYLRRSRFLTTYHATECMMMTYCMTRGIEADNKTTWNYFRDNNLLSPQESAAWERYTDLRNSLSHNYYNPELRQELKDIEPEYIEHLRQLENTLCNIGPRVEWLRPNVYEHIHPDGLCVIIDHKDKRTLRDGSVTIPQITLSHKPQLKQPTALKGTLPEKIDLTDKRFISRPPKKSESETETETYPNGVEITLKKGRIRKFKMPNGISVNFEEQRISWSADVQLHTNSECFNTLQVVRHKLFTDKGLRVTSLWEGKHNQPFRGGDMCLMGQRHRAYISTVGCLKEFSFKDADGNVDKTTFKKTKTGTEISFSDGTTLLLQGTKLTMMHGNIILNSDNRQEFAATYTGVSSMPPQMFKHGGNGR